MGAPEAMHSPVAPVWPQVWQQFWNPACRRNSARKSMEDRMASRRRSWLFIFRNRRVIRLPFCSTFVTNLFSFWSCRCSSRVRGPSPRRTEAVRQKTYGADPPWGA